MTFIGSTVSLIMYNGDLVMFCAWLYPKFIACPVELCVILKHLPGSQVLPLVSDTVIMHDNDIEEIKM